MCILTHTGNILNSSIKTNIHHHLMGVPVVNFHNKNNFKTKKFFFLRMSLFLPSLFWILDSSTLALVFKIRVEMLLLS